MGEQFNNTKYSQDIRDLVDIENGWHFSALKASEKKLPDWRLETCEQIQISMENMM